MKVKPLNSKLLKYLKYHNLISKYIRQILVFQNNPLHPSLHTEILLPRHSKIYSYRIDRIYIVIFIIRNSEVEIIDINDHYE